MYFLFFEIFVESTVNFTRQTNKNVVVFLMVQEFYEYKVNLMVIFS